MNDKLFGFHARYFIKIVQKRQKNFMGFQNGLIPLDMKYSLCLSTSRFHRQMSSFRRFGISSGLQIGQDCDLGGIYSDLHRNGPPVLFLLSFPGSFHLSDEFPRKNLEQIFLGLCQRSQILFPVAKNPES